MFLSLLGVTLVTSLVVSFLVTLAFSRPVSRILDRVVADEISRAWSRYVMFAIFVVGVSGGVRIYSLEQYVTPQRQTDHPIELNTDRWILEVYRTVIGSLQAIAWMLLVFFVVALLAYVIVRVFESRRREPEHV
jgi:uncharacterized membrane protein YedE/YeeE